MENFFELIYDEAAQTGQLDFEHDRGYRRAHAELDSLIDSLQLDSKTENSLMNAVYDLAYCAEIGCLAYGFRLAVQVIRPVRLAHPKRA